MLGHSRDVAVPAQAGSDPFTDMRQGKKDRIRLNEKQQMGNLKTAIKASGSGALPATLKLAARLPEHGKGVPTKRKDLEADVRLLLSIPSQVSWVGPTEPYSLSVLNLGKKGCKAFATFVTCCPSSNYILGYGRSSNAGRFVVLLAK